MTMKSQLLLLSLLALPLGGYAQQNLSGDVNGDGQRNISDVTAVISAVLNEDFSGINAANADMTGDGMVNISDVTMMIGCLLNENWPDEPSQDEGDWVDLGLPSGTIWATRNVGASAPEDYGDYFAWGETEPKEVYDWDNYKWFQEYYDANGDYHGGYTKYCIVSGYGFDGFVDNKKELDPSDDAACAHYSGGRMPSLAQIQELCDSCYWQWTQRNGVNGQLVTGPNGNTMFLPAASHRWYDSLISAGSDGSYWSRTLSSGNQGGAYSLYFKSGILGFWKFDNRGYGFTVRAVRVQ